MAKETQLLLFGGSGLAPIERSTLQPSLPTEGINNNEGSPYAFERSAQRAEVSVSIED